jgi:hypothetical protein
LAKLILHDLEPMKRSIAETVTNMVTNARRSGSNTNDELYQKVSQDYNSLDAKFSRGVSPTNKATVQMTSR